jgi:ribosomal protein L30E
MARKSKEPRTHFYLCHEQNEPKASFHAGVFGDGTSYCRMPDTRGEDAMAFMLTEQRFETRTMPYEQGVPTGLLLILGAEVVARALRLGSGYVCLYSPRIDSRKGYSMVDWGTDEYGKLARRYVIIHEGTGMSCGTFVTRRFADKALAAFAKHHPHALPDFVFAQEGNERAHPNHPEWSAMRNTARRLQGAQP